MQERTSLALQPNRSTDSALRRVLIVSDAAPHRNGVGAYYQDLMYHLGPQVACIDIISPAIVDGRWQGGLMLPLPGDATQKFCIPNLLQLRQQMEAFAPDVVVIPTPGLFGMFGARYARQLGARVVVGFHTWYEKLTELYWNRLQGSLTRGYFEVSNRLIFRNADVVLANSAEMVAIAERIGAPRSALMGTPVSPEFLQREPPRVPSAVRSVLFAGRLAAEKNLEGLLAAARAMPQLHFAVAGDGPQRALVETAAEALPNLDYLGWLDREGLLAAMDAHDALILPSHVESFGTIALEAMARQRLVVVSDACGIADWRELAQCLVIKTSAEDVTAVLSRALALSEFEVAARARQARQAVVQHNQANLDLWLDFITEPG